METRVAVIGVIVEDPESVEALNRILHEYAAWIIGRMGIPYRERGISLISIALDAPPDTINALSGSLGRLTGVTAKTAWSSYTFPAKPEQPGSELPSGTALELSGQPVPESSDNTAPESSGQSGSVTP